MGKFLWPRVLVSVVVVGIVATAYSLDKIHSERFYAPAVAESVVHGESAELYAQEPAIPIEVSHNKHDGYEDELAEKGSFWFADTQDYQDEPSLSDFLSSIVDAIYHLFH